MAQVALLIDGENIAARYFAEVARHCLSLGNICSSQVFADFSGGRQTGWLDVCREFGVKPEFQLSRKGKNSVDIAMTIAAMDLLASGAVDAICLVSSDRDFIPLAQRIRRSGLVVVGLDLPLPTGAWPSAATTFALSARSQNPKLPRRTRWFQMTSVASCWTWSKTFASQTAQSLWRPRKSASN